MVVSQLRERSILCNEISIGLFGSLLSLEHLDHSRPFGNLLLIIGYDALLIIDQHLTGFIRINQSGLQFSEFYLLPGNLLLGVEQVCGRCLIGHIETTEELLALIVGILESGLVPSLQVEHGDLMLDSHYLEFVGQTLDLVLSGSHSLLCLSFSYLCLSLLFVISLCHKILFGFSQQKIWFGNSLSSAARSFK